MSSGIAALVVATALAGGLPGQAQAAGTSGPSGPTEVATLPAPQVSLTPYRNDLPLVAGATGFLHQEQGIPGYVWTDYTTGADTPQPKLASLSAGARFVSAGGDRVAYRVGTTLTVGDPTSGTWTDYTLPQVTGRFAYLAGVGVNGTRAAVEERDGAHLFQLNADGSATEIPLTGLPSSTDHLNRWTGGQLSGDLLAVQSLLRSNATPEGTFLVSLASAAASPAVPSATVPEGTAPRVAGDYLLWESGGSAEVHALKVADVLAGTPGVPSLVQMPSGVSLLDYQAVGQQVLALGRSTAADGTAQDSLWSLPLAGGPAVEVDALVPSPLPQDSPLAGGVGGVLVAGGTSTSQAVQRITAAADGSLEVTPVRRLPAPPQTTATLSMAYGQVRQVLALPGAGVPTQFGLASTLLVPSAKGGSALGFGPTNLLRYWSVQPGSCVPDASCVRVTDGSLFGPSYVTTTATSATVTNDGGTVSFPSPDTTVVAADHTFTLINSGGQQYLWEPGSMPTAQVAVGPVTGATLWQGTLWRATAPGVIQASAPQPDLTGAPTPLGTISTGAACTASEVQVAQHWLYWTCGSSGSATAGVYDLATGVEFPVKPGPALLGDGYLVRHDAASGQLVMTDIHTDAVGADTTLATLPAASAADDRGITWTVDRNSGDVAYADADNTVHVLTTGIPASAPTMSTPAADASLDLSKKGVWFFDSTASRPLAGWRLVITSAVTGQAVHVATGGPTAGRVVTAWQGLTDSGKRAVDGAYRWQLWATPADDPTGPATVAGSGTLPVNGGEPVFRGYDNSAGGTLYGLVGAGNSRYKAGTGVVYQANGHGSLVNQGPLSHLPGNLFGGAVTAFTLFGDLDSTGVNGTLVRTADGSLWYYQGLIGDPKAPSPAAQLVGGGWNVYDRLVSVGDLNGDGHDDLVARDRSGVLWFYAGTGHGGFAHRVRLGGGWNTYTQITGVGDVNGDGAGDLLAVDGSGVLWRYFGNGHGGFGGRVRIGGGWGQYNALVGVGDLLGQGHNSIVARDRSGVLWRYDSTAEGGFGARVRLGGGWNAYAGLY